MLLSAGGRAVRVFDAALIAQAEPAYQYYLNILLRDHQYPTQRSSLGCGRQGNAVNFLHL
jgi:hypothetical protein